MVVNVVRKFVKVKFKTRKKWIEMDRNSSKVTDLNRNFINLRRIEFGELIGHASKSLI